MFRSTVSSPRVRRRQRAYLSSWRGHSVRDARVRRKGCLREDRENMVPMRALPVGLSRVPTTSENRRHFVRQKSSVSGGRKALREIVNRYQVFVRMLTEFKLKTFKIKIINRYKV